MVGVRVLYYMYFKGRVFWSVNLYNFYFVKVSFIVNMLGCMGFGYIVLSGRLIYKIIVFFLGGVGDW